MIIQFFCGFISTYIHNKNFQREKLNILKLKTVRRFPQTFLHIFVFKYKIVTCEKGILISYIKHI